MRRGSTPIIVLDVVNFDVLGDGASNEISTSQYDGENVYIVYRDLYNSGDMFSGCDVYLTVDQDGNQITKSTTDNDGTLTLSPLYDLDTGERIGTRMIAFLSQRDTLNLDVGRAEVQFRWIKADGTAHVSDISTITLSRVLLEEVIVHG